VNQLTTSKPNRLFTFGCSFTQWHWVTWADIVAYDLDIPYYNFGNPGSGNQYIFNILTQAINKYQINQDDLVMICWTNSCREDRRFRDGWECPANIFHDINQMFNKDYAKKIIDFPVGSSVRDFATMDASRRMLDTLGCQYHMLSMSGFDLLDQWGLKFWDWQEINILTELKELYKDLTNKILPDFYQVLWDNEISNKFDINKKKINAEFNDHHPSPQEALDYLTTVFKEYKFNNSTVEKIDLIEEKWVEVNKQIYDHTRFGEESISTEELKIIESLETNFI